MKLSAVLGMVATLGVAVEAVVPKSGVLRQQQNPAAKPPNFLFIMSDDQDLYLDSMDYMPLTVNHFKGNGTTLKNHFVTTSLCCPSRVSLLTGRQAHNTNVTDVSPPWGGYPKFIERGFNDNFLPVWLQQAGYNTYYTGKLMNSHTVENYNKPHAAGFNGSDFLLDPHTYSYYNATFQRNHDPPVSYPGKYSTDIAKNKSLGFLEEALSSDRPFFLAAAPVGPHTNIDANTPIKNGSIFMQPPIPADRHKHLFKGVKAPRTKNFNPDKPSGASWVRKLPKQNQTVIDYNDNFYRSRLQALQAVDELVDALITRLEESGQADNTYIIYTSDNGFHIGQHRMPPGKACPYEEDIRVPFYIRGPGIPKGHEEDAVSTHIDLAPTFFELAGIPQRDDFDGTPLPTIPNSRGKRHEHVTVEFWGKATLEGSFAGVGPYGSTKGPNNTYKSVRILGEGYNLYYSVWCTNEHELYDLTTDAFQLNNLHATTNSNSNNDTNPPQIAGRPLPQLIPRLDTLLLLLKSCKGTTCIEPWTVLHPDGSVKNLRDALDPRYDSFYHAQPRVAFDRCEAGYIVGAEGPQDPNLNPFVPGHSLTSRYGLSWDAWV